MTIFWTLWKFSPETKAIDVMEPLSTDESPQEVLKTDILVIGGGPAGSFFSYLAASAGLDVTLVDKSDFPRHKVCGYVLAPGASQVIHETPLKNSFNSLPHYDLRGLSVSSDKNRLSFFLKNSPYPVRAIQRDLFDDWLKEKAVEAGARVLTMTMPHHWMAPDMVSTSSQFIKARLIIGADGKSSWVAQSTDSVRYGRFHRRVAWNASAPASITEDDFHINFFKEGYLTVVKYSETEANITITLAIPQPMSPQSIINRFYPGQPNLSWYSTCPIHHYPCTAAFDNKFLIGDAAHTIEPLASSGISMALLSAQKAAETIIRHPAASCSELVSLYRKKYQELYGKKNFLFGLAYQLGRRPSVSMHMVSFLSKHPKKSVLPLRKLIPSISGIAS